MEILQGNIVICFATCHYIYFHGGTTTATAVHVVPGVNAPKILVIRQVVVVPTAVLKRVWLEVASVQGVIKVWVPCHQILCMEKKNFNLFIRLPGNRYFDFTNYKVWWCIASSNFMRKYFSLFNFFSRYSVILASVSNNIIMFQNLK